MLTTETILISALVFGVCDGDETDWLKKRVRTHLPRTTASKTIARLRGTGVSALAITELWTAI